MLFWIRRYSTQSIFNSKIDQAHSISLHFFFQLNNLIMKLLLILNIHTVDHQAAKWSETHIYSNSKTNKNYLDICIYSSLSLSLNKVPFIIKQYNYAS